MSMSVTIHVDTHNSELISGLISGLQTGYNIQNAILLHVTLQCTKYLGDILHGRLMLFTFNNVYGKERCVVV